MLTFDHFSHYNGRGAASASTMSMKSSSLITPTPGETTPSCSESRTTRRDTYNIETMCEVYASSGERWQAFPWTRQDGGDFQVLLHFSADRQLPDSAQHSRRTGKHERDRPRLGGRWQWGRRNCERDINVAISQGFGTIFKLDLAGAVLIARDLWRACRMTYWSRRKAAGCDCAGDTMRYVVMLAESLAA